MLEDASSSYFLPKIIGHRDNGTSVNNKHYLLMGFNWGLINIKQTKTIKIAQSVKGQLWHTVKSKNYH